jgi:CBS domain containing-hemolysin-like protein
MSDPASETGFLKKLFSRSSPEMPDEISEPATTASGKAVAAKEVMMSAAERFHLLRVEDVMVPRANIVAIHNTATLTDLSEAFKEAGHSRLPVYKETLDDPVGMVHVKDFLPYLMFDAKGRTGKTYPQRKVLQYIRRPVLFVPPSMLAQELLRRMQARRTHMAIVVDEYGGTDGLVTIEDLIEPIVGDIDDEHDEVIPEVQIVTGKGGRSVWEADARISIEAFEATLGRDFATPDEEEDVDTLGGLIFTMAGRVPERGEIIKHADGLEFEIVDADPRRLKRLRISDTRGLKRKAGTSDAVDPAAALSPPPQSSSSS